MALRALARVNLAAIERNVARVRSILPERTRVCAVVKADGYAHGAVQTARAALAAGASWLAVATAEEAAAVRAGGIGEPLLIMGAISSEELPLALASRAELVAWSEEFAERVAALAVQPVGMHVKLDTGMGRLGTRRLEEALAIAARVLDHDPSLELAGAMTHFATADEDPEFLSAQVRAFEPFVEELGRLAPGIVAHCANSAAIFNDPGTHFDMVRPGVAIYGGDPMNEDPALRGLEPVLSLHTYVAALKLAEAGQSAGYGRRFVAERDTWIATLPIGYADGVRRALTNNGEVLIGGRRYPVVGAVSMDNLTVDVGAVPSVAVGDAATVIGADGAERQTAEDLASRIGTINHEIFCGISARVPRAYHRDGVEA